MVLHHLFSTAGFQAVAIFLIVFLIVLNPGYLTLSLSTP